jgi:hypothetical protein
MCLLAICKTRKLTKEEFENSWDYNDDGFGMGWKDAQHRVHFVKGIMKLEDALSEYEHIDARCKHIVHFRKASVGGRIAELTHPFLVSEGSPISLEGHDVDSPLLFHNGHWADYKQILIMLEIATGKMITDPISDTRVAAMYLARVGNGAITRFGYNRVALLTPEKERSIIYSGEFVDENGVLFSNTSYKYSYKRNYGTYGTSDRKSYMSYYSGWGYRDRYADDYTTNTSRLAEDRLEEKRESQRSLFPSSSPIPDKSKKKEKKEKHSNIRRLEL